MTGLVVVFLDKSSSSLGGTIYRDDIGSIDNPATNTVFVRLLRILARKTTSCVSLQHCEGEELCSLRTEADFRLDLEDVVLHGECRAVRT
jgi:hypothetical protein